MSPQRTQATGSERRVAQAHQRLCEARHGPSGAGGAERRGRGGVVVPRAQPPLARAEALEQHGVLQAETAKARVSYASVG